MRVMSERVAANGRTEYTAHRVDAPEGVGWTALIGAAARARERERPDALFDDPWAPLFLDAAAHEESRRLPRLGPGAGPDSPPSEMWRLLHDFFVGRTPFIDAEVLAAQESGLDQFVLLGAGLDARAERLDLAASSVVFEVDSAELLAFKDAVLARHGIVNARRVPVAADLGREWFSCLIAAGFAPQRPTCWVIEGLLIYLDDAAGKALLSQVREAGAVGSRVVLDHVSHVLCADDFSLDDPQDQRVFAEGESLMTSAVGMDPHAWSAVRGLHLTKLSDTASELNAHGRSVPTKLNQANPSHLIGWLLAGVMATS